MEPGFLLIGILQAFLLLKVWTMARVSAKNALFLEKISHEARLERKEAALLLDNFANHLVKFIHETREERAQTSQRLDIFAKSLGESSHDAREEGKQIAQRLDNFAKSLLLCESSLETKEERKEAALRLDMLVKKLDDIRQSIDEICSPASLDNTSSTDSDGVTEAISDEQLGKQSLDATLSAAVEAPDQAGRRDTDQPKSEFTQSSRSSQGVEKMSTWVNRLNDSSEDVQSDAARQLAKIAISNPELQEVIVPKLLRLAREAKKFSNIVNTVFYCTTDVPKRSPRWADDFLDAYIFAVRNGDCMRYRSAYIHIWSLIDEGLLDETHARYHEIVEMARADERLREGDERLYILKILDWHADKVS